eukprot:CAMPEP_0178515796 /NCGR_PEP_ID=MMETSP0696-20121128/24750_1 /TAXON_ID=265572 /ORGANISM="Extubocellulus spinifer, Strain CCMP396" /LENGTH=54 /DNA_ID=CAMNT_0020145987 /DNA_START=32 /DNA_END=196 /DNA_ORIENTATION=-
MTFVVPDTECRVFGSLAPFWLVRIDNAPSTTTSMEDTPTVLVPVSTTNSGRRLT